MTIYFSMEYVFQNRETHLFFISRMIQSEEETILNWSSEYLVIKV